MVFNISCDVYSTETFSLKFYFHILLNENCQTACKYDHLSNICMYMFLVGNKDIWEDVGKIKNAEKRLLICNEKRAHKRNNKCATQLVLGESLNFLLLQIGGLI